MDPADILPDLPQDPGVYLMHDASGRIIYVGKAKNLRRRVSSYFGPPERLTAKTRAMVSRINNIRTLVTSTEKEALLLEDSLIKKHRPRYNILLRDDKQYVLFRLDKRSDFPRLSITRNVKKDGSVHFGPFTSAAHAKRTWRTIGRVFPLRKCSDRAMRNRTRPCIYHHMNQCLAPCCLGVPPEEYRRVVADVEMLLSGRSSELAERLQREMESASDALDFERAALMRDRLHSVEATLEKQSVVLPDGGDLDVMAPVDLGEGGAALGLLFVRQGRLLGGKGVLLPGVAFEDARECAASFLTQYYGPGRFMPPSIIMPWPPDDPAVVEALAERRGGPVTVRPARTSQEKSLLAMARRNAAEEAAKRPSVQLSLSRALRLETEPERIECVDVSHLGGTGTRVGMVVLEDGEPRKNAYRIYSIDDASGDDYRALAAWAERRVESGEPWPDLVVIDGGKGQLEAVGRALRENGMEWELAAIAKGESRRAGELEDRIFRPGRKNPMPLKPGSPELLLLQRLRDEAHRFVLGRQRRSRSGEALSSELLSLDGVGPKTARILWEHFDSLEAMTAAAPEDLAALPGIGAKKAERLHKALRGLRA
ncbi:excinuclease ABC subunit UvrC [Desulfohalovibrio reitneri]|uniref:excinuclease ABC subunit UvrC n=1 Tax=Desulfohalovibrio reitneri TaxID=1307759 RepID=UPI0004A6F90C|nr:excinuclease ABC subunit UvrC [Desulfohalovibrio reitneri]